MLVLVLVLFAIISQPANSAATVRSGASGLGSAGDSMVQFFSALGTGTTSSGSSSSSGGNYTVRSGDTLASIAAANGTTAAAIASRNGIANPNVIRVGQRLTL